MDLFKGFLIKVPVREKLVPGAVFLSVARQEVSSVFLTLILGLFGWKAGSAGVRDSQGGEGRDFSWIWFR